VRKEWRTLTPAEQRKVLNAITGLKNKAAGTGNPVNWNYDQFAKVHWDFQVANHNTTAFFPWHRVYVNTFEKALQTIDPSVSLPYWDWTIDSQRPALSPLFADAAFGSNGDLTTHCLLTGIAKNWTGAAPRGDSCLKRCNDFGILYPPEAVAAIISLSDDYAVFSGRIENGPHGLIHFQVGGECGDFGTMASANDPLFFLHHTMVDRIWAKWQSSCPERNSLFSGSVTNTLPPFNFIISDTFSMSSDKLCYVYDTSPADVPVNAKCSTLPTNPTVTTSSTTATVTNEPIVLINDIWLQDMIMVLLPVNNAGLLSGAALNHGLVFGSGLQSFAKLDLVQPMPYFFRLDFSIKAPPSDDTADQIHLRFPTKMNEHFLKHMNMDKKKVADVENFTKMIIDEVNNQPNYISPAALKFIYNAEYNLKEFTLFGKFKNWVIGK
jgi:tyrosinase